MVGPGAPSYVYVSKKMQVDLSTPLTGWLGHVNPFEFSNRYVPASGVRRILCGSPPILSMSALEVGADLLLEADLMQVRSKSIKLTELFMDKVSSRAREFGVTILTPPEEDHRGSHVSLSRCHASQIIELIQVEGLIADFRPPNLLRFGFSPLYNRYTDVWDAAEVLLGAFKKVC